MAGKVKVDIKHNVVLSLAPYGITVDIIGGRNVEEGYTNFKIIQSNIINVTHPHLSRYPQELSASILSFPKIYTIEYPSNIYNQTHTHHHS